MAGDDSTLLVDVGNTRVKSCWLADGQDEITHWQGLDELASALEGLCVSKIVIASVRAAQELVALERICNQLGIAWQEVHTEQQRFGLTNAYANYSTLGVDRWLAMIAAMQLTDKPFAVIDAGTAITCDFVVQGQHLGGWITPGFNTMRSALLQNTSRVFADNAYPGSAAPGKKTEDCVAMGCLVAAQGVYHAAIDYLFSNYDDFSIIIAGGDKKLLTSANGGDSIRAANMVLQGLARYAK